MKKTCLHIFTKYGSKSASTRHRFFQYDQHLEEIFDNIKYFHLLDNHYFEKKIIGNKIPVVNLIQSISKRAFDIFSIKRGSIVIIHTELIPYFPSIFEFILKLKNCPYILDIDDALFHQYDQHKNFIIRFFLKNKIKNIMKNSNAVLAGSPYIKDYAIRSMAPNTYYVPTVIDLDRYQYWKHEKKNLQLFGLDLLLHLCIWR